MDTHTFFGYASGVISCLAFIRYYWTIVRGESKPNLATWLIWSIVGFIIWRTYGEVGAKETIWLALTYFVLPTITLLMILSKGRFKFKDLDYICLGIAAISLVIWQGMRNPLGALITCLIADLAAATATMRTTWREPLETLKEDKFAWVLAVLASFVNLFAIEDWSHWQLTIQPVYYVTFNFIIMLPLYTRKK